MATAAVIDHAARMDAQYGWQRHIYDLTRKYYLLGRDRLIRRLDVPSGGSVLEIGCGTGRNLALVARRYPEARLFGLDISAEMLKHALRQVSGARLARADATHFDAHALFGQRQFDRVFISYSLSMIPGWEQALDQAARCVSPGGSLHIVDFGRQEGLPRWFRALLFAWLGRFHVTPRAALPVVLDDVAQYLGLTLEVRSLYRGYAVEARLSASR
ncbi:class I SAM-dependent methyltransferase [Sphingobium sp. CR28]|uniref:class I SAM-dependent methyltransferase n=1 Tax=Sphingobium sp. CR28 TaxID=3400272 RepID=UPI003FEDD678